MTRPLLQRALVLAAVAGSGLVACSNDASQRTEAHYCTEVGNHLADLSAPTIATQADIDRVVTAWRTVSAPAPLAVQDEWEAVIVNLETAATVDPNDPASVQRVADTARATEQASNRVISYTQERCGATIGATPAAP